MEVSTELKCKTATELESWFLASLSEAAMPADAMLAVLEHLVASGETGKADELADLMQELAIEKGLTEPGIRLLELRAAWRDGDPGFRVECRTVAAALLKDREGKAFYRGAGFDQGDLGAVECLRRLQLLRQLKPGVLCRNKTWGFGVIRHIDDLYDRVSVDFKGKPGHRLSFAHAAESLELLDEAHLLARAHRAADDMKRMAREEPGEIVRIALRSYGPMPVVRLKETLVPDLLTEGEWKPFWESARKALRSDPLVDVPAKRSDPIRLLAHAKELASGRLETLKSERDPERILDLAEEFVQGVGADKLSEEARGVLRDRLDFAVRGCDRKRPDLVVRAILLAGAVPTVGTEGLLDMTGLVAGLLEPDRVLAACAELSARQFSAFLDGLGEDDRARCADLLLSLLEKLPGYAMGLAIDFLVAVGRETACAERMAQLFQEQRPDVGILHWLCRHSDTMLRWRVGDMGGLLIRVVECFERTCMGERLKIQKQLRALLEQREWMESALALLTPTQREELTSRIHDGRGIDVVDRRSILGLLIRLHPELEKAVIAAAAKSSEHAAPVKRYTSWRSYRERREQLRKLVEETVPANSREIELARSYGDLSENHEYKAAKEHQGVLLRLRGELERDLRHVQGVDFDEFPLAKAGIGTCVTLRAPDGSARRYSILGEWDRDESLGIISNQSRMARALEGRKKGETVSIPSEGGEVLCTVEDVAGLPENVKDWLREKGNG